jgi:N-acetylmuramoyl-L-alanine amidase
MRIHPSVAGRPTGNPAAANVRPTTRTDILVMAVALIEPRFITDPFGVSIMASTHGQEVIASGLATAVKQYFDKLSARGG